MNNPSPELRRQRAAEDGPPSADAKVIARMPGEALTNYLRRVREAMVAETPKADPTPETLR